MEQKDYLLREIEKIGLLLRMILNTITSRGENNAIVLENQFEEERELLLHEIGFNINEFILLESSEVEQYISKYSGIRGSNIELLADIIKEFGMKSESNISKACLEKALKLYELCNSLDKTYSIARAKFVR